MKLILNVFGMIWVLGVITSPITSFAAQRAGHISLVRGDVFILNSQQQVVADPTGKRGRNTQRDSVFNVGEIIQTKSGARVKLVFDEGQNEIVMGENTSLTISRAGVDKAGTELDLAQGTVRSSVHKKYSDKGTDVFQVKTPNGVAGVRGTVFQVSFNTVTGKTSVFTEQGSVWLQEIRSQRSGRVTIEANQFSEVQQGTRPSVPKQISNALRQNLNLISPEGEPDTQASRGGAPSSTNINNSEAPSVALGPSPTDTLEGSSGSRGPASLGSTPATPAPSQSNILGAPTSSISPSFGSSTADKINQQSETMRRQAQEALRQQRLNEGIMTDNIVRIK